MKRCPRAPLRAALYALLSLVAALLLVITGTAAAIGLYGLYASDSSDGSPTSPASAEAAIVLGAAVRGGQPSPALRERLEHGLALHRARRARRLVLTGGSSGGEPAEALVARRYVTERGVPAGDILLEQRSRTTEGNLYYAAEVARRHGIRTFLLVSDPLHMRRAITMARDLGLEIAPSPTPTTVFRGWRSRLLFLARETYKLLKYLSRRSFGEPFAADHL